MSVILFWRHRSNIRNLLSGTEGRIEGASPDPSGSVRRAAAADGRQGVPSANAPAAVKPSVSACPACSRWQPA